MPATHVVKVPHQVPQYAVLKNDREEPVIVLQETQSERGPRVYVHYVNLEKRHDEWVSKSELQPVPSTSASDSTGRSRKRKRTPSGSASGSRSQSPHSEDGWQENGQTMIEEVVMNEEDYDIQHHKQIYAQRNFDKVHFGEWLIKTWYFSPYPLTDEEAAETASQGSTVTTPRIPGVSKLTARSHGRTLDMLAGGLGRKGEKSLLWVCDMCFKYMTDGQSWEAHKQICTVQHPPGRKVYQRGAHTIWEVDGAKSKLYCQNLSLFGKLFIDVKTLFFDCDNFLFYILTDATSKSDHMLGFFSKEKVSYDDYNLACIITLPPFQRKGFGILMIEFSYELSRRAGKVGTPERPLSDLGLRSYLAYWVSTLIRFFRKLLTVMPLSAGPEPLISKGYPPDLRSPTRESSSDDSITPKRRKRNKGWDGEVSDEDTFLDDMDDKISSLRTYVTTSNPDGSATTHLKIECTLEDIARATNLRVEDAAFALNEVGMLMRWGQGEKAEDATVILTKDIVEKVAMERNLKNPCINLKHVLL